MIPINRTYAPVQAFVDELVRCGMTDTVTSPGSRNAPLVLTLAAAEGLRAHSVVDERAAGFVALGLAKASGRPVAVTCTSGSAAANLMPAVVEAWEARVPLIVLTADRPPELRDVGAGQSIDQVKLYGDHAAWFVEVGNHEPTRATAVHFRALACRAWWTALEAARPVHLNWPLREPLAPVREELETADWAGRPDGQPWVAREGANRHQTTPGGGQMSVRGPRGVVIAGSGASAEAGEVAERLGWPLLADAISGLRRPGPAVVSHYDVLLRVEGFAAAQRPDFVLRFGDLPTSKPLRAWLAGVEQWAVDPLAKWQDPTHEASRVLDAAPEGGEPADPGWLESWRRADALVPEALAATPDPFEPKVWAAAVEGAPEESIVWVASSMPIRDVEAFVAPRPVRFLSNRGANGIDGTIASAAGAALARGGPAYVLLGDVALVHDIGGLLAARRLGLDPTVVCANNEGGNIFDYLPVAGVAAREPYEEHIVTPTGVSLERVAALADMEHVRAESPDGVRTAAERAGPLLVEAPTNRARNVELHRELVARVAARL